MSPKTDHSKELNPGAPGKEVKKPLNIVHDFLSFASLPQAKEYLWSWLKTTVAGDFSKSLSRAERSDLIYFYEQLQTLIEAIYQLHSPKK